MHPRLCLEEDPPKDGCRERQRHKAQQAGDVENGCAYIETCYGAYIYA